MARYFLWPVTFTIIGLAAVFWLGLETYGTLSGALSFFFIGLVLSLLEISLSFDNAIVNANKLQYMTPIWQRRFLTWGILIAVFGMRIIFPLAIVAIAANIGPIAAIKLAVLEPDEYARIIDASHVSIAAFGGTFLMMVALTYFVDEEKDVDWFVALEGRLRHWASLRGLEIAFVILVIIASFSSNCSEIFWTGQTRSRTWHAAADLARSFISKCSMQVSRLMVLSAHLRLRKTYS
jgi:hypothetical protein